MVGSSRSPQFRAPRPGICIGRACLRFCCGWSQSFAAHRRHGGLGTRPHMWLTPCGASCFAHHCWCIESPATSSSWLERVVNTFDAFAVHSIGDDSSYLVEGSLHIRGEQVDFLVWTDRVALHGSSCSPKVVGTSRAHSTPSRRCDVGAGGRRTPIIVGVSCSEFRVRFG